MTLRTLCSFLLLATSVIAAKADDSQYDMANDYIDSLERNFTTRPDRSSDFDNERYETQQRLRVLEDRQRQVEHEQFMDRLYGE